LTHAWFQSTQQSNVPIIYSEFLLHRAKVRVQSKKNWGRTCTPCSTATDRQTLEHL